MRDLAPCFYGGIALRLTILTLRLIQWGVALCSGYLSTLFSSVEVHSHNHSAVKRGQATQNSCIDEHAIGIDYFEMIYSNLSAPNRSTAKVLACPIPAFVFSDYIQDDTSNGDKLRIRLFLREDNGLELNSFIFFYR